MATKVKGEAIKEGSIPLSALSNEVKGKIENAGGGADWNAQEGAAGYIENKPFYDKGDIRQIDVNGEYEICVDGLNIGDRIDISWDLEYYNGEVFEVFRGSASFVIQAEHNHNTYYYKDDFGIFGREGEDGLSLILYAHNGADSHYGKVTVMVNGEIKTLEEKYIPNTVLKTTPQILSDDDKNQALANLGIPRVLNIDSHGIEDNLTIDELSEILGDCVTNEILIQGLCHKTKYETVYLPTLHQSYVYVDGRKILNKLVCGQYRVDEDTYDVHLVVAPSIYLHYDEETQRYRSILEEY